jgi:hypothetical protein
MYIFLYIVQSELRECLAGREGHGASVFPVLSEGPPQLVASCDTQLDAEDLF